MIIASRTQFHVERPWGPLDGTFSSTNNYAALTLGVAAGVEQRVGPLAAAGERVVGEAGVAGEAEVRGDGAAGHHLHPRHAAARGEEAGRAGHAPRPAHQHAAGGRGGGVRGRRCGLGQSGQGGWGVVVWGLPIVLPDDLLGPKPGLELVLGVLWWRYLHLM